MTQDQMLLLVWVMAAVGRLPRILERWKAPFLNGAGWFFGVQVPPDFLDRGGRAILHTYRWRLFLPWAVELPITAALLYTGHHEAILVLILVVTLLTRLNYYADRQASENKARRFETPAAAEPVVTVSLSLQPRTLRSYTKLWIETTLLLTYAAVAALVAYRYSVLGDWHPLRPLISVTLFSIYLQIGTLLAKRAFVRARSIAPAAGAEQYLVWRESLRRLSTSLCDYVRLMVAIYPVTIAIAGTKPVWQGSTAQTIAMIAVSVFCAVLVWLEWRTRMQHLEVTRASKPTGFLIRPDTQEAGRLLCFQPDLPMLLLKVPQGYSLNLASAPVRTAGLYVAGCLLLVVYLTTH